MKTKFLKIIFSLCIMAALPLISCFGKSQGEIKNYTMTISNSSNGVLQIGYNFTLKATEDISSVTVVMPNNEFSCTYKAKNIKSVEKDGKNAIVTFNSNVKADSTVDVVFQVNQPKMYRLDDKKQVATYKLKASEIKGFTYESVKIRWNLENVTYSSANSTEGNYRIWNIENSLFARKEILVKYGMDSYKFTKEGQSRITIASLLSNGGYLIVIFVIIAIGEIISNDNYRKNSGFRFSRGFSSQASY